MSQDDAITFVYMNVTLLVGVGVGLQHIQRLACFVAMSMKEALSLTTEAQKLHARSEMCCSRAYPATWKMMPKQPISLHTTQNLLWHFVAAR